MRFFLLVIFVLIDAAPLRAADATALPTGFVYLQDVAPDVLQEMRYAGSYNFTGRVVPGYLQPRCILTAQAAAALKQVQQALQPFSLGLKVWDCYRPTRAVDAFSVWSRTDRTPPGKNDFLPHIRSQQAFRLGYLAHHSGHSRGSTVDLTLVPLGGKAGTINRTLAPRGACNLPAAQRGERDPNALDMGTAYDCFDGRSAVHAQDVSPAARAHRLLLRQLMHEAGFVGYKREWWHFTLRHEPHPAQRFDFVVQ